MYISHVFLHAFAHEKAHMATNRAQIELTQLQSL